ncbi:MAG: glycosyltransferase [Ignavibacteriales bacterium]|nr:glycosyltransferase [Ignavibacteriales bacterium]
MRFSYVHKSTEWPTSKLTKFVNLSSGIFKLLEYLHHENSINKIDVILLYGTYLSSVNLLLAAISKFRNIIYVFSLDEYPDHIIYPEAKRFYSGYLFERVFIRRFDYILVISKLLMEYCDSIGIKKEKILFYPLTAADWKGKITLPETNNYFFYSGFNRTTRGSHSYEKDDPQTLFKAFSWLSEKFPDVKLIVAGQIDPSLQKLAAEYNISEKTIFTGKISDEEYHGYLNNALGLVIPRPDNPKSEASVPFRLGEFLLTGNPVIVTRTVELDSKLKDGEHVFFYTPEMFPIFKAKLKMIIDDPILAKTIGEKGKLIASEIFNLKSVNFELMEKINKRLEEVG